MTIGPAPAGDIGQTAPPDDPSPRIEAVFAHIAETRMQGLPYLNPHLLVAAVGFRLWRQSWIGVLVTPWGINLLQLPAPDAPFAPWRGDETIALALPGATLSFMPARLDALGDYRLCPLFSPAQQFADQQTACATARAVLGLLFEPDADTADVDTDANAASVQPALAQPRTPARIPVPADRPDPGRRKLFGLRG